MFVGAIMRYIFLAFTFIICSGLTDSSLESPFSYAKLMRQLKGPIALPA